MQHLDQVADDVAEAGLALQHFGGQAVHVGGSGVDTGVEQRGEALLDVAVVAEGQCGDADDAGLPWAEAGGLDVDDRPARAGLVCRPAPGLAHIFEDGTVPRQTGHGRIARPRVGYLKCRGWSPLVDVSRSRPGPARAGRRGSPGRGAGAMIGGLVAMTLDKSILRQLGEGRRTVVVTGTNGKSTTTRMTAAALGTLGPVATNAEGANMDAGLVAALAGARDAELAALEVDEMHVPHVADAVDPAVIVLLNLSRDQLDRVGEINHIERTLRGGLARHPSTVVVANCDDVLMTSAAYDSPNVVWVAAGGGWANDSVSCPRSGEIIVRDGGHWYSTGTDFKRPTPQWWYDDANIYGPDGLSLPMTLALPGTVNRGNATQAVAAAVAMGADPAAAVAAVSGCRRGRGPLQHGAARRAHRADAAGQESGRLAGGAVDGRHRRRLGGDLGQRSGARRRGPVVAVGRQLRAFRRPSGGGRG